MPLSIERADYDVSRPKAGRFGVTGNKISDGAINVNRIRRACRPSHDFVHVAIRGRQKGARVCCSDGSNRSGKPARAKCCSFERIDSNIPELPRSRAEFFTARKHRRLIEFTFADRDNKALAATTERVTHSLDRGCIGGEFVSFADPSFASARRSARRI